MRLVFSRSRFRPRRCLGAWPWFSLLIFASSGARAQAPSEAANTFTFGNSDCPEPTAVEREVRRLIPSDRQSVLDAGVRIELQDLGESYRVTVSKDRATVKKSYADAARDCDGRARFAAVFAVLTIMPPELEPSDNTPEPEPPPPPPAPTPIAIEPVAMAPAPPLPPLARVDLAGLFVAAPALGQAPKLDGFGGELGVGLGRGAFAGKLSLGYVARSRYELEGVVGDVATLPASAGVQLRSELGPLTLAGELGLLALLERARSTNLARSTGATSLDLGARAGLSLAWPWGRRFAPFVGVFTWLLPAPRELSAAPQGVIGNLPYWWVGGAAGVSLGL